MRFKHVCGRCDRIGCHPGQSATIACFASFAASNCTSNKAAVYTPDCCIAIHLQSQRVQRHRSRPAGSATSVLRLANRVQLHLRPALRKAAPRFSTSGPRTNFCDATLTGCWSRQTSTMRVSAHPLQHQHRAGPGGCRQHGLRAHAAPQPRGVRPHTVSLVSARPRFSRRQNRPEQDLQAVIVH